jgi:hypothetical protein
METSDVGGEEEVNSVGLMKIHYVLLNLYHYFISIFFLIVYNSPPLPLTC